MKTRFFSAFLWLLFVSICCADGPLVIEDFQKRGNQAAITFPFSSGVKAYTFLSTTNLNSPWLTNNGFALVPYGQPEFIIDNTSALVVGGTWATGTSSTDKFGTDYRNKGGNGGTSYLQFTPNLPVAGEYNVYVWYPQGSNRTTNAPHIINYSGGSTIVYVNQKVNGGKWNLLGKYNFAAGTSGFVRVTDGQTDGNVVLVDAIRFQGVNTPVTNANILSPLGYEWRATQTAPQSFYLVQQVQQDTNTLLAAHLLNRLAYGPTPDELTQLALTGVDAYISNQLHFELIAEPIENSHTNISYFSNKMAAADEVVDYVATPSYSTNTNYVVITNNATMPPTYSTNTNVVVSTNYTYSSTNATMAQYRAYHVLRAVGAKRQLLEVLLQFLENHFVTQYSKTRTFFDRYFNDDGTAEDRLSAQLEYLEQDRWRTALLKTNCTFYDLLKISAESPAMIIYLDTVDSRSDGGRIANENYAREILELFTFGVDNGYDQNDITIMSRCWAGWTVGKVPPNSANNPFATNFLTSYTGPGGFSTNTTGVWSFLYNSSRQNPSNQVIFSGKTVPSRFGSPWAGRNYQLNIPARTGTNGIRAGYDIVTHLADQPFTQEYISIKLCRLFVHDNFPNPSNDPSSPSYAFYNYAAGNLSPEAELVRQCMLAWENGTPKGQIRDVLKVIFDSDLFRTQLAMQQKVKTPLEYCVGAIRALRTSTNATYLPGSYSSDTDGLSISGSTSTTGSCPLARMGQMILFDRNDPNGYPENGEGWISGGTLAERVRFVQTYLMATGDSSKTDSISGGNRNTSDPVALLQTLLTVHKPGASMNNPADVADFFIDLIFPGEGEGNLVPVRNAAISFLETGDDGVLSSPFSNLSGSSYDTRVRGMVAMLMSMARFQEQ